MALLLSLETSTHAFSCALHQDGNLVAFKESPQAQTTASKLTVFIEELFQESGFKKNQLGAVVVAAGPGSYTGLRIGVATAKGICFALNVPLISENTLKLLANQFVNDHSPVSVDALLCPMLDARRMEVYCTLTDTTGKDIEPVHARVIDEQSFALRLEQSPIYFFGEGAEKCKDMIRHSNAHFVDGIKPLASALGVLGLQKWRRQEFEDLDIFEPLYLKDFLIKKPNPIY